MINIKALRDQRAAKAKEARNLLDTNTGDKWSKDVEKQVDDIYAEIDRIDAQITRAERQAEIDGEIAADEGSREAGERALNNLSPDEREAAQRYSAAFRNFLIRGERGLTQEEAQTLRTGRPQNAQSVGSGASGGYLVPQGFGGELLEALKAFGGMRRVATTIQTASGATLPWPTVDETGQMGEIVAENTAASAQDASFGTTNIGSYKWSSKVFTLPFELLQDQGPGMDVEAFVRRAASTRIGRAQNAKYTNGTGTNEPTGIVTSAPVGRAAPNGQTTTVTYDDMVYMEHSIDPAYREMPGVGWMFHDTTLRSLKLLKDAQGHPLWLPGLSAKDPDTFLRYRYTINQDMPQQAASAKSILFGDMSEFLIRDVMEVTLFRFDDSAFTIKGQVGFLAWARGDGKLVSGGTPVKAFQQSAT
ncbi:phage major capsid protein [Sphingomonas sp. H39-1-10]|uniref:phage major capsid protein n=1 Tax=Sphingomonas pollutisoli TaxID=3030829 RepID=UPI0023B91979|nr:phage major capsid protein [Sphingomonas pollutisoli]MDF0489202.1 phage major capsid protein [Sphingomonas pollutisoli]